jgi:hypothetical protein
MIKAIYYLRLILAESFVNIAVHIMPEGGSKKRFVLKFLEYAETERAIDNNE